MDVFRQQRHADVQTGNCSDSIRRRWQILFSENQIIIVGFFQNQNLNVVKATAILCLLSYEEVIKNI